MANHPNADLLAKIYEDLSKGDIASMLARVPDGFAFQLAGKSPLAGKYDKATLPGFFMKMHELSDGNLKLEVHDIFGNDRHGVVLCSASVARGGKKSDYRSAHVWRFEGGKPVAWYDYMRDTYAFDAAWS